MAKKAGMATGVEVARISVKVSPDTKGFRAELKRELEDIERTLKGDVHITAHLDTAQARADFLRLKAAMERDRIKVGVDIDNDKIGKKIRESVSGGAGGGGGGGKKGGLLDGYPSFGSGINPAGYAVILGAVVALAAPLLGLITTTLLAIPGMVAAIATPIAAITLGLDGFKKAAESIKQPFEDLKATMSNVTESAFTPVMQRIADEIFPKLSASLPKVTEGLAEMAKGALDGLSGPEMQRSITNIGNAFAQMRPGIEGFTSGFSGLIEQFTLKLPNIAEWFNDVGTRFDEWVAKISADGSLGRAFDGLGTTIDAILESMGRLALEGLKWIQDPAKVEDFVDGLKDLLGVLESIAGLSSTLNDMFKNMLPSLNWDGIKEDLANPFTSEDAPWRKLLDPKDPAHGSNRIPAGGGTKSKVDEVTNSIKQADAAAQQAIPNINKVTGQPGAGGLPGASAERRGATGGGEGNKIPPPDDSEAKAKLQEYNTFVEQVSNDVKTAMKSAAGENGTVPPPNFDQFKAAWNDLPKVVTEAMNTVVQAVRTGGDQAAAESVIVGQRIVDAMRGIAPLFQTVGLQMMQGLATGIQAGSSMAINAAVAAAINALNAAKKALDIRSPSRKFMEIGDYSMQGLAKGMENGFKPVLDQATDMANKIADAFASGADPTALLEGFSAKEESRMEKVLGLQSKLLGSQAAALDRKYKQTKDESLKAAADAARERKAEIDDNKAMLDLAAEYAELQDGPKTNFAGSPMGKMVEELTGIPQDFFSQTAGQFMNDVGIGGNGALEAIGNYAMGFANKYVFNVSNIDEALAAQKRQETKQSIGMVGR